MAELLNTERGVPACKAHRHSYVYYTVDIIVLIHLEITFHHCSQLDNAEQKSNTSAGPHTSKVVNRHKCSSTESRHDCAINMKYFIPLYSLSLVFVVPVNLSIGIFSLENHC